MNEILRQDAEGVAAENINWEKLKNSKVLITGASGMIGSSMARVLTVVKEKHRMYMEIYALVRNPHRLPEDIRDKVSVIKHDVTQPLETGEAFDYIIHAASPASPLIMKDDPVGTIAANTLGAFLHP